MIRPKPQREIPKSAKRVFKGVLHDVYQWQQMMYDGTYSTFEMLKRIDSVNIIPVTAEGKILILHQEQPEVNPFWSLAGGRIEADDKSPEEAAKRELLEETGFKAQSFDLWFTSQPSGFVDSAIFTYIARECVKSGPPEPDNGEKITVLSTDLNNFLELVFSENFRDRDVTFVLMKLLFTMGKRKGTKKLREILYR